MARNRAYDAPAYDRGTTARKLNPRTRWRELTTWGADAEREGAVTTMDVAEASTPKSTVKFPVREDLNALVRAFECGEEDSSSPWLLDVEVVTCAARESMKAIVGTREPAWAGAALRALAGDELEREMARAERARTGDCAMTSGCRLPARRIAHCVGPRYAEKYATAAENALCHCYVNALSKCVDECKARTIACTPACAESKGYPSDRAAMVTVRTIRRFLERWSDKLDCVVVCAPSAAAREYARALSVYFPRNDDESAASERVLRDVPDCNEYGEMILDERRMRIEARPGRAASASDFFNTTAGVKLDDDDRGGDDASIDPAVSSVFMSMNIDPEARRQRERLRREEEGDGAWWAVDGTDARDAAAPPLTVEDTREIEDEHARRASLLRRADSMDVSDVGDARAIYLEKHRDYIGRRVVVVVAAYVERLLKAGEEQRLLAHVAKEFRGVTDNPRGYIMVYHHAGGAYGTSPSVDFLRKLRVALGPSRTDTLKCVYVVHPTSALRAAIWAMDAFRVESSFCGKVEYVDTVCDLREYVRLEGTKETLEVPGHVEEYERELALRPSMIW